MHRQLAQEAAVRRLSGCAGAAGVLFRSLVLGSQAAGLVLWLRARCLPSPNSHWALGPKADDPGPFLNSVT